MTSPVLILSPRGYRIGSLSVLDDVHPNLLVINCHSEDFKVAGNSHIISLSAMVTLIVSLEDPEHQSRPGHGPGGDGQDAQQLIAQHQPGVRGVTIPENASLTLFQS